MSLRDRLNAKQSSAFSAPRRFETSPVSYAAPIREDRDTGRVYVTPAGNVYPSATTILGKVGDKSWLDAWRDRIGHDEAERITNQSGRRGTAMHGVIERYIDNCDDYLGSPTPVYLDLFRQVKPRIDQSLGTVFGNELPLFSDYLRASGTADLCAEWDGVKSIVDWKNARRFKRLSDIEGYFIQTGMYAIMYEERTGIPIPQLVIVMAVENNAGDAVVFKQKRSDWDKNVLATIKEYYAKI